MADFIQEVYHVVNSRFSFCWVCEKKTNELGQKGLGGINTSVRSVLYPVAISVTVLLSYISRLLRQRLSECDQESSFPDTCGRAFTLPAIVKVIFARRSALEALSWNCINTVRDRATECQSRQKLGRRGCDTIHESLPFFDLMPGDSILFLVQFCENSNVICLCQDIHRSLIATYLRLFP
jgi:hypothetical protein